METIIKLNEFNKAYEEALRFLKPYITYDTCKKISLYDKGMDPDRPFNFIDYLERSLIRYQKIFQEPLKQKSNWLEIGSLFPALPIALFHLGFNVSVIEQFSFYPNEILKMYEDISNKYSIKFINNDLSCNSNINFDVNFDYISLMGVIEHLPHTPKILLENIRRNLKVEGIFFLDVPNFYYGNNVIDYLSGKYQYQNMQSVYYSSIPFVGHHREYSVRNLKYVLKEAGFQTKSILMFNYSYDFCISSLIKPKEIPSLIRYLKPFREIIFAASTVKNRTE